MVQHATTSPQEGDLDPAENFEGGRHDVVRAGEDVIDRVFDALDVYSAGEVDFCELASGLSVRSVDKSATAFAEYYYC